jgi:hypothetical protein
MAPENKKVSYEDLSDYQKIRVDNEKDTNVKLISDLKTKFNYPVYSKNLAYYLSKGMQVLKIHEIISFKQDNFLKKYIDLNTNLRSKATNDFQKNLYKLLNNSCFGKTCEDTRNHLDVKIIYDDYDRCQKAINNPLFSRYSIINPNVVSIIKEKSKVKLDKPIYLGFVILETSKLHMYKFYYDFVKVRYGDKAKLIYTDTDSLILQIETEDWYADMKENIDLFDTSDYPKDNIFGIPQVNKKVIGKFKDELCSNILTQFCVLRPKMYSFQYQETPTSTFDFKDTKVGSKRKAKGIQSNFVAKSLNHDDYLNALNDQVLENAKFYSIKSSKHNITTNLVQKKSLNNLDTKRFLLTDGINSLAFGHSEIQGMSA